MLIISAPWVVPIESPVIRDGSIVVADRRIVDLGKRSDMVLRYPHFREKTYSCVLMPGLVNAHMHLELSYLHNTFEPLHDANFTEWIDALIQQRFSKSYSREEIVESFTASLRDQFHSGVALIGDIGNEYYTELHQSKERDERERRPRVLRMLEYLGPNRIACREALKKLDQLDDDICATGHAPYSTTPELLQAIKRRCKRLQHVFSIHTCESQNEREFLQTGKGCFRDFLERRGSWDRSFTFDDSKFSGTIEYFDHLGLLDEKTLLVHCVHISKNELEVIKEHGSAICLCPGSNQFLRVGSAPVEHMIGLGLLPALGTDSPASNRAIDIWREMRILADSQPDIGHLTILAMATIGGAKALGHDDDLGSLAVGKKAEFIHASSTVLKDCTDDKQLVKELVSGGKPAEITWVSNVHE